MMNTNRKLLVSAAFLLFTSALLFLADFRSAGRALSVWCAIDPSTKATGWYFKPREDGQQPEETAEAKLLKQYGGYYVGSADEPVIYLTFDMGFEGGQTAQILDTLQKHEVPAAFFMVEHYITSQPDLVKRMVSEGHIVGNHSTHHKNMAKITDLEAFRKELCDIEAAYEQLIGQPMPAFYRPPEGQFSELSLQYAQQLGYTTVMWSFAYKDWEVDNQPSRDYALGKIYPRTHNGEIVLLHATSQTNADILDEVLTHWKEQGYRFASLNELPGLQQQTAIPEVQAASQPVDLPDAQPKPE